MRLGRMAAMVLCAALVGAVPAGAQPHDGGVKVKQCKRKQHKRFACERTDGITVTATCPEGYSALSYTVAPDADVNGNLVICYSNSGAALDDTP